MDQGKIQAVSAIGMTFIHSSSYHNNLTWR